MGSPVVHWELWTKAPDKTCDFYRRVFDWKTRPIPEMDYHLVETGGEGGINGGIMTPPRDGPWPGNMSFYIDVDDLAAYRKRVQEAGGKILVEEQQVQGMGAFSLFSDPDGRIVGIWKKAAQPDIGGVDPGLARHGHVSYLEVPANDVEQSAIFYEAVFGWSISRRDADHCSFDDRSGSLIGRWTTGRAVSREPGLLPYIYVDHIDEVVRRVVTQGGEIVKPVHTEGDLWIATFRDPAGNLMGIWQAGPR